MEVIKKAYLQGEVEFEGSDEEEEEGEEEDHDAASPRNVGHNIYILAHQVSPTWRYPLPRHAHASRGP